MTEISPRRRETVSKAAARTDEAEVRRFERTSVSLPAVVKTSQFRGMVIRGMVRYIAEGGLMVELPVEVVSGSIIHVQLQTRQGLLEVEGKVVWTAINRGKVRHGLAFPDPPSPDFLEKILRIEKGRGLAGETSCPRAD